MSEYGFSLTRIFPTYVLIRENTVQRKLAIWYILGGASQEHRNSGPENYFDTPEFVIEDNT